MKQKTAALLVIGDEVLSGRTQDLNTSFIATRLGELGIDLVEARTVRDVGHEIVSAVNELRARVDYLFTTGGIGPTHDDITSENIAKAFGVSLDLHPEAKRRLEEYYKTRDIVMNEARLRMAMIPCGAILIDNPVSTAPGYVIGNVYVMAGVPKIMQALFENIAPRLCASAPMIARTVVCNAREGDIAEGLTTIQNLYPDIKIGSYPAFMAASGPTLSLVLRGRDAAILEQAVTDVQKLVAPYA